MVRKQTNWDLAFEMKKHTDTGEKLLWAGKPRQGLLIKPSDIILIPFSLLWGGFAIFWEYMAISGGAPFFFALFGVPFVLIGIYLIIGRFFYDSWNRKNTSYAVTNKRLIIKSGVINKTISSFDIQSLSNLNVTEKPNGWGSILINSYSFQNQLFKNSGWPANTKQKAAFEMIPEVRKVYRIITESQSKKHEYL